MGNQQILLLILGVIIVSIAVAVGMGQAREYFEDDLGDEIHQTLLWQAEQAKIYFGKPKTLGGGGGSYTGFSLPQSLLTLRSVKYIANTSRDDGSGLVIIATSNQDKIAAFLKHTNAGHTIGWLGTGQYKKYTNHTPMPF